MYAKIHPKCSNGGNLNHEKTVGILYDYDYGCDVYVMSFVTDSTSSSQTISSTIMPLVIMYGFFGIVLFMIGKKGHDSILSR